jgi:hypothetical protein
VNNLLSAIQNPLEGILQHLGAMEQPGGLKVGDQFVVFQRFHIRIEGLQRRDRGLRRGELQLSLDVCQPGQQLVPDAGDGLKAPDWVHHFVEETVCGSHRDKEGDLLRVSNPIGCLDIDLRGSNRKPCEGRMRVRASVALTGAYLTTVPEELAAMTVKSFGAPSIVGGVVSTQVRVWVTIVERPPFSVAVHVRLTFLTSLPDTGSVSST